MELAMCDGFGALLPAESSSGGGGPSRRDRPEEEAEATAGDPSEPAHDDGGVNEGVHAARGPAESAESVRVGQELASWGIVRPVRPDDRPDIVTMASFTYGGHDWILDELDSWMTDPQHCITLGIELNSKLVALENLRLVDDGRTGWLEALRVHPGVRRRGMAARLQRHLVDAARERWPAIERFRYTTASSMVPSLRLAKSCGMEDVHRWGFELVSPAGEPKSIIRQGEPRGLLEALRTELARADREDEADNASPSRIELCMTADSAAELAKRVCCPNVGLICDWKVEMPCEDAMKRLYASGARVASLRSTSGREALVIGKTRPDFSDSVRVFTIESCGGGTLAECYRDFLELSIYECETAIEDGTRACMFFYSLEFRALLLTAGLVGEGKECVLLEARREGAPTVVKDSTRPLQERQQMEGRPREETTTATSTTTSLLDDFAVGADGFGALVVSETHGDDADAATDDNGCEYSASPAAAACDENDCPKGLSGEIPTGAVYDEVRRVLSFAEAERGEEVEALGGRRRRRQRPFSLRIDRLQGSLKCATDGTRIIGASVKSAAVAAAATAAASATTAAASVRKFRLDVDTIDNLVVRATQATSPSSNGAVGATSPTSPTAMHMARHQSLLHGTGTVDEHYERIRRCLEAARHTHGEDGLRKCGFEYRLVCCSAHSAEHDGAEGGGAGGRIQSRRPEHVDHVGENGVHNNIRDIARKSDAMDGGGSSTTTQGGRGLHQPDEEGAGVINGAKLGHGAADAESSHGGGGGDSTRRDTARQGRMGDENHSEGNSAEPLAELLRDGMSCDDDAPHRAEGNSTPSTPPSTRLSHERVEYCCECATRLFHVESDTLITASNLDAFVAHGPMYDEIARMCQEHAQDVMMEVGRLAWVTVDNGEGDNCDDPTNGSSKEAAPDRAQVRALVDEDLAEDNRPGPILLIVTGRGKVRAGIFSRRHLLISGIERSTALPMVRGARDRGMKVVLLDPNARGDGHGMATLETSVRALFGYTEWVRNDSDKGEDAGDARDDADAEGGSGPFTSKYYNPQKHPSPIFILAYSESGAQLVRYLMDQAHHLLPRIAAIAFTDSTHNVQWTRNHPALSRLLDSPSCLYVRSSGVRNNGDNSSSNDSGDESNQHFAAGKDADSASDAHWRRRFGTVRTVWAGTPDHGLVNFVACEHIWSHFDNHYFPQLYERNGASLGGSPSR